MQRKNTNGFFINQILRALLYSQDFYLKGQYISLLYATNLGSSASSHLSRLPMLDDNHKELCIIGHHNLLLLGTYPQILELMLGVEVAHYPSPFHGQALHELRILLGLLLRHLGVTPQHRSLTIADHVPCD
mmetsp:Transcript_1508/g.1935  ORF Transcript_1508/g.1935 Transcript_1508/m.1935 type:complete len:131 (-) Transcript_1508:18-410(-)